MKCSGKTLQDLQKQLGAIEGATLNLIEGGLQVIIDQKSIVPLLWKGSKKIMDTALKAAIPGAVLGLLAGLKDSPEKPITSTQFNCTTLEEYAKVLDSEVKQKAIDPKYKDALMMIAATFITEDKDGNKVWDCEGYKTFLNNAAGNGGVLNREELIGAVQQLKDKPPVEHTDEEDDGDEEITTGGDEEGETVPEKCPLEKIIILLIQHFLTKLNLVIPGKNLLTPTSQPGKNATAKCTEKAELFKHSKSSFKK